MADAWTAQQQDARLADLDFDTRFSLLVDAEHLARDNRRIGRALKEARLRIGSACLEDIDFSPKREIDKRKILDLGSCLWVDAHHNIVITGPTGVGKTYLACALAHQALRRGKRALYRRVPRLFQELALAHADGTYTRLLARIARFDVLVLDDWAIAPLADQHRADTLEILEDRYGLRSTVITSQLPTSNWHDYLGDPTLADAICDRVLHNAQKINLKGPSKRKEQAPKN
jgi:DNA replication protein DnaC